MDRGGPLPECRWGRDLTGKTGRGSYGSGYGCGTSLACHCGTQYVYRSLCLRTEGHRDVGIISSVTPSLISSHLYLSHPHQMTSPGQQVSPNLGLLCNTSLISFSHSSSTSISIVTSILSVPPQLYSNGCDTKAPPFGPLRIRTFPPSSNFSLTSRLRPNSNPSQ